MNFDPQSQTTIAMVGGIIRAVLSALGGAGILSGDQMGQVAGALAVLVTMAWSIYQKHHTATTTVSHETLTNAVVAAAPTTEVAREVITAAKAGAL